MTVSQKVRAALQHYQMIPVDRKVIVGVSGGADSLALLHVLVGLRERLDLALHVVTVDHRMRGDASIQDAEFVVQTCSEWQVPVTMAAVLLRLRAGANIEAALRSARYRVFASVAAEIGATTVAVAHQADDQAETTLMHLLRGGGLRGLAGMGWRGPLPEQPELTLIRPMLDVTRSEVDAYCAEHQLSPRVDATNRDLSYLRNRLRHDVLPSLRAINPQIDRALIRLADVASVEDAYMDAQLAAVLTEAHGDQTRLRFPRSAFVGLHPALQRRFIRAALSRIALTDDLTYEHVIAAVELALRGEQGARALLTGGAQMRIDYEMLVFEQQDAPWSIPDMPLLNPDQRVPLLVGITPISKSWAIEVASLPQGDDFTQIAVVGTSWLLRTRREGDQFAPANLKGHTRSLSRWMIDRKIPATIRGRIPLLEIDGQLAAIAYDNQWIVAARDDPAAGALALYLRWLRRSELER